jgi:DNA modification methylase
VEVCGVDDCRLILGDCLDVLLTLESGSVDAVVTDPPYGVGLGIGNDTRGGKHGLAKRSYGSQDDTYQDFVGIIIPRLNMALDLAKRAAVFTGPHIPEQRKADALGGIYCAAGVGRHQWGFKTFLPILFYGTSPDLHGGARSIVLASNAQADKNGHPCPKPLEWMRWLIKLTTRPGETVLDPFAGSGTTGIACLHTGRKFIGIEISPDYHAIARKRLAEVDGPLFAAVQPSLFTPAEEGAT